MALRNQPYFPLYADDFLSDEKLSECSAESTGVYIRIMCVMHKSNEYGKILLKQKDKQSDDQIKNFALKLVKHLPYAHEIIERSLVELISEDVLQIHGDYILQKRMVKDGEISDLRAKAGSKGGRKSQGFAQAKVKAKPKAKVKAKVKANSVNGNVIVNIKDIDAFFEQVWKIYPNKKGKGQISDSKKAALHRIGVEEITRAIERYIQELKKEDWRKPQYGSTFFNSGYIDYLDENYQPEGEKLKSTVRTVEIPNEWEDT